MKKSNQVLILVVIGAFATVLILVLAFRSCAPEIDLQEITYYSKTLIVGNGKIMAQSIPVNEFDSVNISGKFTVDLENAKTAKLTLTTDENVIPTIQISSLNKVLDIHARNEMNVQPKVVIGSDHISEIALSGKSELHASNLHSDHLKVVMSGKSQGFIQGDAKAVKLNLFGKSELHATFPNAESITVDIYGNGTLYLTGKAKNLSIISHGKSVIVAKDMVADVVEVESAGESNLILNVVKSLDVNAFGKSSIQYYGNPVVTKKVFGNVELMKL